MAFRIAYTQYKRRHGPQDFPLASNATFVRDISKFENQPLMYDDNKEAISNVEESHLPTEVPPLDKMDHSAYPTEFNERALDEGLVDAAPGLAVPVAIFPQYLAQASTCITIREVDLPRFHSSFAVFFTDTTEDIFTVQRERLSFTERTVITDTHTKQQILTIRRNIGNLPRSYKFEDATGATILDLQGNFFVPTQGTRATALFTNAVDRRNMRLFMQGSWHNRNAAIKDMLTGEIVASMTSELLNVRNLVGSRRTYVVAVTKGVDLVLITAMIVALNARGG